MWICWQNTQIRGTSCKNATPSNVKNITYSISFFIVTDPKSQLNKRQKKKKKYTQSDYDILGYRLLLFGCLPDQRHPLKWEQKTKLRLTTLYAVFVLINTESIVIKYITVTPSWILICVHTHTGTLTSLTTASKGRKHPLLTCLWASVVQAFLNGRISSDP